MKKFAVIGLGRLGMSVATTLSEKGQQVLAIDKNEELVHDIMDVAAKAVCLDAADEKAVRSVGLANVDVAVCAIGTNIEASILVTLLLKELGVPVIVCKAISIEHKKVLDKIGADKVILPEKDMGVRIADMLISFSDKVLDHIGLSGDTSIIDIVAPDEFVGKSLRDLEMRVKYGLNVIAIKKKIETTRDGETVEEEKMNVNPQADDTVAKGDILVVFGENEKIDGLKKRSKE